MAENKWVARVIACYNPIFVKVIYIYITALITIEGAPGPMGGVWNWVGTIPPFTRTNWRHRDLPNLLCICDDPKHRLYSLLRWGRDPWRVGRRFGEKMLRFAKISGKTGECPVGDFELFPPKKTWQLYPKHIQRPGEEVWIDTQKLKNASGGMTARLGLYGCFRKYGYPQIIHFNMVFHGFPL